MIREAMAPYTLWIKPVAALVVVALVFWAGANWQGNRDAALIAKKDEALRNAARALQGSSAALRQINTEAARRIHEAERLAGAAIKAGEVADAAKIRAMHESEQFAADLDRAKKRRPACAELSRTLIDLEDVCGVSVR